MLKGPGPKHLRECLRNGSVMSGDTWVRGKGGEVRSHEVPSMHVYACVCVRACVHVKERMRLWVHTCLPMGEFSGRSHDL